MLLQKYIFQRYPVIFLFAPLWILPSSAQEVEQSPRFLLGVYGGVNANLHQPDFPLPVPVNLPFPPASGRFDQSKTSVGYHFGVTGEYRFSPQIAAGLSLGYFSADGALQTVGMRQDTGGSGSNLQTDLSLDATLRYFEIVPNVRFYDVAGIPSLFGFGGIEFSFPVANRYTLTEVQSDTVRYVYDSSAAVPDAGLRAALQLGIGYNFQVSDKWSVSPALEFRFPFTKVSGNTDFDSWRVPQVRFSVSVQYDFSELFRSRAKVSSLPPLNVALQVGYYNDVGEFTPLDHLTIEEVAYAELYPIIPYLFFERGGTEIPKEYLEFGEKLAVGQEKERSVPQDALVQNYGLLDLIGKRMQEYSQASLRIVGTTDGKEPLSIAQQRAEAVKRYLVATYGIAPNRILVEARRLPEKPSAINDPDGQAENRRVEFYPSIPEVLDPVFVEQEKVLFASPELIEFRPEVTGLDSAVLNRFIFTVQQAGDSLHQLERRGRPEVIRPIRWKVQADRLKSKDLPIEYSYRIEDEHNRSDEATGLIPLQYQVRYEKREERLPDRKVQKFSLVLFDFDRADLTPQNQRVLDKYVLPAIQFNSVVRVYGYTDRIGDTEYNKNLAQRRAETVVRYLQSKTKAKSFVPIGVGEDVLLYDNDRAIGRQLSRTVQIVVETPMR